MLKIGVFSKLSRISIRMLRHYDEQGVLIPKMVDPQTGYRYYSEDQLPNADRISALHEMGFALSTIKEILESPGGTSSFGTMINIRKAELKSEQKTLSRRLRLLDTAQEQFRKDGFGMKFAVGLKELPERSVASVRKKLSSYEEEGTLWKILMEETSAMNLQSSEPCYTMAIFHDGEYKEGDVDVEVQKTVVGAYENTENVVFKTVPPITFASATYKGGYDKIGSANEAVADWVESNGYEFDGLSFNIYHVSPHETNNPNEYVTEVCYPVRKKA